MSMLWREEKKDSSSSRQRDVMEFIFTCEIVMFWLLPLLGCCDDSVEEDADPAEAARRPGPGESEIELSRRARRGGGHQSSPSKRKHKSKTK